MVRFYLAYLEKSSFILVTWRPGGKVTTRNDSKTSLWFHRVHQNMNSSRSKDHVPVQSKKESVFHERRIPLLSDEIGNVHHLTPSLPVADLSFVFQMNNHFRLSRKNPRKATAMWSHSNSGLFNIGTFVRPLRAHHAHQFNKFINEFVNDPGRHSILWFRFKRIVKKDVRLEIV